MYYDEKCCYQNIDYRYLTIYTRFQILLVSKSIGFFAGGGSKLPPPLIKHLVEGPLPPAVTNLFSRAFQQLKYIGSGKCNPLENV